MAEIIRSEYQYLPYCENCKFFRVGKQQEPRCGKHSFVMPRIDWLTLCQQWQGDAQPPSNEGLASDTLYYYSQASDAMLPLAPFAYLQRPLFSVGIREDSEMGWVMLPRLHSDNFPAHDSEILFFIGEQPFTFYVKLAERKIALERFPTGKNTHGAQYYTQQVTMLYSSQMPTLLQEWLNSLMDIGAYLRDGLVPNFFAFVEVITPGKEYALHADLLVYQKYVR